MHVHSWTPAVEIEIGLGKYRHIASVEDAARHLLGDWPGHGDAHRKAQQACLDAIAEKAPASRARKAFIEACREADIFVRN